MTVPWMLHNHYAEGTSKAQFKKRSETAFTHTLFCLGEKLFKYSDPCMMGPH